MQAINCPRRAGFDTPGALTIEAARKFKAAGYAFGIRYLTRWPVKHCKPTADIGGWFYALSRQELADCMTAELPIGIVQAADTKDDPGNPWDDITPDGGRRLAESALEQLEWLEVPKGITVFFDAEYSPIPVASMLIGAIEAWGELLVKGGFQAGMYFGPGTGLTAEQAWDLRWINRYWRSASAVPFPSNRGVNMQQGTEMELFGYDIDQNLACIDGHHTMGRIRVIAP